jgi:uncharacterized protein with HEPN domain
MPPDARDAAVLWDLLNAAQNITGFTRGVTLDAYRANLMLRRAVERELSIIGEAARRTSDTMRAQHPHIPWRMMVALRNVLTHAYDEVDDERIWRVAVEDIPSLIEQLQALVPPPPQTS